MSGSKIKLFFAPRTFPYGANEVPFLYTEFESLVTDFDVTIISAGYQIDETIVVDEFKKYKDISIFNIDYQGIGKFQRFMLSIMAYKNKMFRHEILSIIKTRKNVGMRIYQAMLNFAYAWYYAKEVESRKLLAVSEPMIFYTFWYDVQTLGIMLLKSHYPQMKIVSRIHGFDLYNEQRPGDYQPFRKWMDGQIDRLFFISETGKNYYLDHFAIDQSYKEKYVLSYLGTKCKNTFSPIDRTGIFELVSCSSLIELKRVNLIVEALSLLPRQYHLNWNHFGDGVCMGGVQKLAHEKLDNHDNVSYVLWGNKPNREIFDWYGEKQVNCFINVSSTEGLPVSAQEAVPACFPVRQIR